MSIWLARVRDTLVSTDEESLAVIRKMGQGECRLFAPIRVRNAAQHRLYFKLCRTIGQNQDPERDENSIDAELRFRAGHKEFVGMIGGQELWIPKRIAFDKLSAEEWDDLMPRLELAASETFGIDFQNMCEHVPMLRAMTAGAA